MEQTTREAVRLGTARGRWVLVATILGSSLAGIDATVVNIALPRIGEDLHASFAGLQWTVSAYTLTLAALILWSGALGDVIGQRRVYVAGIALFAVASALCAVAPSLPLLIAARAVQGVGGALVTPTSLAIIEADFAPEDRAAAVGTWAGFGGIATAVAPLLGGWILAVASWRWVFVINLPVAVVIVAVVLRHVPEHRVAWPAGRRTGASDWRGALLTVVGLAALTWAALGTTGSGQVGLRLAAGLMGLALLAAFVWVERRSDHPLVPLSLFSVAEFRVTNLATFLIYGAIGTFFFLLVIALQVVSGFSPLAAGISSLPITVLILLLSSRSAALAGRIGPRLQLSVGPVLCAGGVLLTLRLGPSSSYVVDVLPVVVLFGLGLATFVAPLTSTALSSAPDDNAGVASGVNNAIARSGSLLAVALVPVLTGLTGDAYASPTRFLSGFRGASLVIVALLLASAAVAFVSLRPRRATGDGPPEEQARPELRHAACRPDPLCASPGLSGASHGAESEA